MSELDDAWAHALSVAERRARTAGRNDVVEYLALRNSNDLLRTTGIRWLMDVFTKVAAEANRVSNSIQSSRHDGHRFRVGNATMVGSMLTLRQGVRTLFIEAGWPRTPRDGIVRGGGLACGNIKHLGMKSANRQLLLTVAEKGVPCWLLIDSNGRRTPMVEADARRHVASLFDEN